MRPGPLAPALTAFALAASAFGCGGDGAHRAERVDLFAAASLCDVVGALGVSFAAAGHGRIRVNLAATSELARQIENGAPADVFLSADPRWTDHVIGVGWGDPESRVELARNALVWIRHGAGTSGSEPLSPAGIEAIRRFAIASPEHVPAGRYAEEALRGLGVWSDLAGKIVSARDVRAALAFVETGEADEGIVYATDATGSTRVHVVRSVPATSHRPIRYELVLARDAPEAARAFAALATGSTGARALAAIGFLTPSG